jgi:hypothetical protein
VQAGLLALDHARVAGEEALALERDAELRIGFDQGARAPPCRTATAAWRARAPSSLLRMLVQPPPDAGEAASAYDAPAPTARDRT